MALWGDKEVTGANAGTITITANGLVAGTSTLFDAQLEVGNFILANDVEYRVISVTSNTVAHVAAGVKAATVAGVAANTYTVSEKPKFVSTISELGNPEDVYFVDTTEAGVAANKARGINTPGWVQYTTYQDSDGNNRHRSEVLVAMKRTAAAAGDAEDTVAEDS